MQDADVFRTYNESQLPGNYGCVYSLEETWGASPLRLQTYDALWASVPVERVWALLNVKYVLSWRKTLAAPSERLGEEPKSSKETTYLHRLNIVGPRAYVAYAAHTADDAAALKYLADPKADPFSDAVVSEPLPFELKGAAGGTPAARITIVRRTPGRIALDVSLPSDGLLVLSEVYYPGWRATVDGADARLLRAQVTLRGLPLRAGDHRVEMAFQPLSFTLGAGVSGIALLFVIVLIAVGTRAGRPGHICRSLAFPAPMIDLSPTHLRELRLRAQCLHPPLPRGQLIPAVRAIVGAQAQLSSSMRLQLRARVVGLTIAEIEEEISGSRRLVRTWAMRGTLHLLLAEDVRWLGSLLGPVFAAQGRRRRLQLGLDDDVTAKGLRAIRAILSDSGPLTRGEVVARLEEEGLALERHSQAPIHLIGLAALEGLVCLGPERANGESTYTLIDRWIEPGQSLTREQALAELAHRYIAGYGPAAPQDFAAWAGLSLTDAKRGWASVRDQGRLTEVRVEARVLWRLAPESGKVCPSHSSEPVLHLLPAFDPYVLGYEDRRDVVLQEHHRGVYHGGQTAPVVLIDGRASGVWRYERQGRRLQITVQAFDSFDPSIRRLIAAEADDIGRFWQAPVSVSYSTTPP